MMDKIVWDEERFSVGHPLLDRQHKVIVETINSLIDLSRKPHEKADLMRILTRMSSYSSYHFGVEESLLRNAKLEHLDQQVDDHEAYTEKVTDLIVNCTGRDRDKVLIFLIEWWIEHILIEDMKFKGKI